MRENYSTEIDTFLFRRSWGAVFKDLDEVQAGKLIKAIYLFTEGEDVEPEELVLKTLYKMITNQINYSSRKYLQKVRDDDIY